MAKIIDANCKKCNSRLSIDIEQKNAFCPYCGERLIKNHRSINLKKNKLKNLFSKKPTGFQEAGTLLPNNENVEPFDYVCPKCSSDCTIDLSHNQGYCKNCGIKLIENGIFIDYSAEEKPKARSSSPFKKIIIPVGAGLLALIVAGIITVGVISEKNKKNLSAYVPTESRLEELTELETDLPTVIPTKLPTQKPTNPPTQKPTNPPTEKPTEHPTEKPTEKEQEIEENAPAVNDTIENNDNGNNEDDNDNQNNYIEYHYILNNNTRKFHYPDCSSVKKMAAKNKEEYYGTREDLISMGYSPCAICHP